MLYRTVRCLEITSFLLNFLLLPLSYVYSFSFWEKLRVTKKSTTWTIWLVLALTLLGQTASASYNMLLMCESLGSDTLQTGSSSSPHHMTSTESTSCCDDSSGDSIGNCEMQSCVIIGMQTSEFNHNVAFNISQTHFDLQYQHVLITLDSPYRPPIFIWSRSNLLITCLAMPRL